jgi:hypothetical protein
MKYRLYSCSQAGTTGCCFPLGTQAEAEAVAQRKVETYQGCERRGPKRKNSFLRKTFCYQPSVSGYPDIPGVLWTWKGNRRASYQCTGYGSFIATDSDGWLRVGTFSHYASNGRPIGSITFSIPDGIYAGSRGEWIFTEEGCSGSITYYRYGQYYHTEKCVQNVSHYRNYWMDYTPPPLKPQSLERAFALLAKSHEPSDGQIWRLYTETAHKFVANTNTIGNAKQACDLVRCVIGGGIGAKLNQLGTSTISDLPKVLADCWLTYRYSYQTTKADCTEYYRLLSELGQGRPSHLTHARETVDEFNSVSFSAEYTDTGAMIQRDAEKYLRQVGLYPTASNVWDLLPFSFIVDWFTPIGEWCEFFDTKYLQDTSYFGISDPMICNRWTDDIVFDNYQIQCQVYHRYFIEPDNIKMSWLDEGPTSAKTITMRTLDAASLAIKMGK